LPAKSKQQYKYIKYLQGKYGSKEKAPEKYKWAFDKDYEPSKEEYKKLPDKKEGIMKESLFDDVLSAASNKSIAELAIEMLDNGMRPEDILAKFKKKFPDMSFNKLTGILVTQSDKNDEAKKAAQIFYDLYKKESVKTFKVNKEFQLPGTDIILEEGDIIEVKSIREVKGHTDDLDALLSPEGLMVDAWDEDAKADLKNMTPEDIVEKWRSIHHRYGASGEPSFAQMKKDVLKSLVAFYKKAYNS
jgi:hypothetical protein